MLKSFYKYRRYSYAFAAVCMICGFIITWKMSAATQKNLEKRLSILPAPVFSEDPADLKTAKLFAKDGCVYIENTGGGTIYTAETDNGVVYEGGPLKPGEKAKTSLAADGPEIPELTGIGIDK